MPLDTKAFQKAFELDQYQGMKQRTDPQADAVIEQVIKEEGTEEIKRIFDLLIPEYIQKEWRMH